MKRYNAMVAGTITNPAKLLKSYNGKKTYEFELSVKRQSGVEDIIPVSIEENVCDIKSLYMGNRVFVKGYLNTKEREDNTAEFYTFVSAREVTPARDRDTNSFRLYGYICKNSGLRYTRKGKKITELTLVIPRYGRVSDYISCLCWNDVAETVKDYRAGTRICVEGRLESRGHGNEMTHELSVYEQQMFIRKDVAENQENKTEDKQN